MVSLKRFFIVPFILCLLIASVHASIGIAREGLYSAWLGSLLAVVPSFSVFVVLMGLGWARTSARLPVMWICGLAGSTIALALPAASSLPLLYAVVVGFIGSLVYDFWYSALDRDHSKLKVGQQLPDFLLTSIDGQPVSANDIRQAPALMMFYRGNWCPLCMAQIKEVASHYQALSKRGVKVYMVSNQSEQNSADLAKKFDVEMNFLVDKDGAAARLLGLVHEGGTPAGMAGYEVDTSLPTVIITDETGKIIFADLTDNYRVRPEPEMFIQILDEHNVAVV